MGPLDYSMDVLSPFQAALTGFGAAFDQGRGRHDMLMNQEAGVRQQEQLGLQAQAQAAQQDQFGQDLAFRQQQFGLQQQQFEAQQAQVAAEEAAQARGQAAFQRLISLGADATIQDYQMAMSENPELAGQLQQSYEMMAPDRQEAEKIQAAQLLSALQTDPAIARQIIADRIVAAEAIGDAQAAATMKSFEMMMDAPGGEQLVGALVGTSLAAIMGQDEFNAMGQSLGWQAAPEPEMTNSTQAMIEQAELQGIRQGTPEMAAYIAQQTAPSGMTITTNPDGTMSMTQGPGAARPISEMQSRLQLFGSVMTATAPVLLEFEKIYDPANAPDAIARAFGTVGNYFRSSTGQQYTATASAWAEGALRLQTGAAATAPEIERIVATYFARAGDTAETVATKRTLRALYEQALIRASGGTFESGQTDMPPDPMAFAEEQQAETPAVSATPPDFSTMTITQVLAAIPNDSWSVADKQKWLEAYDRLMAAETSAGGGD